MHSLQKSRPPPKTPSGLPQAGFFRSLLISDPEHWGEPQVLCQRDCVAVNARNVEEDLAAADAGQQSRQKTTSAVARSSATRI